MVSTVLDKDGHLVHQRTLVASRRVLVRYLRSIRGPKQVAIEATGAWEPFVEAVREGGGAPILSNALKTSWISLDTGRTDKTDSTKLATLLWMGTLPSVFIPPPEILALRHLVHERDHYVNLARSSQTYIYALLRRDGIDYPDRALKYRWSRALVRSKASEQVLRAVKAYDEVLAHVEKLDEQLHEAYTLSPEAQLLTTIPGVGEVGAVALVAYLCPIERFSSAEKVSSYAGVSPATHTSGDTRKLGRMKWDSQRKLRTVLFRLTITHLQAEKEGDVAKVYARVWERRSKGKARGAAMHQLLRIIYAVLKRRTPYLTSAPQGPRVRQTSLSEEPLINTLTSRVGSMEDEILGHLTGTAPARRRRRTGVGS